jgi:nitrogen fixation protein FixH
MIALAITTWPGLETADAFRKGIGYNAALAAAREQAALGWRAELAFKPAAEQRRRGRVELRLTDAAGRPVERAEVRADLVRPTRQGHDFTVFLERAPGGIYALETEFPLAGIWDVRLLAEDRQKLYQTTRRIVVP